MKGQHYYDQLTMEQQERWRRNTKKVGLELGYDDLPGSMLKDEMRSMRSFIGASFTWDRTPEGFKYWYNIAHNLPVPVPVPVPAPEPTRPYNSGVMLGLFIGVITGTLLSMATRDWTYQLIGLDILLMAGIVYLYRRYRNEHPQGR